MPIPVLATSGPPLPLLVILRRSIPAPVRARRRRLHGSRGVVKHGRGSGDRRGQRGPYPTRPVVGTVVQGEVVRGPASRRHLGEHLVGLAHVQLLVEDHAELAYLLQVAAFGSVEGEAVAPDGEVALGESHDVPRH